MVARFSRRGLAAGLLATAAATAPGRASPLPRGGVTDPVHRAIEAARLAQGELTAAIRCLNETDPGSVRNVDRACDRSGRARDALSQIRPTTPAGLRALVRFHVDDVMRLEPDTYGADALRDVLRAMDALLQVHVPPG